MHKYHRYEFNKNKCPLIMFFVSGLLVSLANIADLFFIDKMPNNMNLDGLYDFCIERN